MRKAFMCGIAAAFISMTPALADECKLTTAQAEAAAAALIEKHPNYRAWIIKNDDAKKLTAYINAQPPKSEENFDEFIFAENPDAGTVVVLYALDGCVKNTIPASAESVHNDLKRALGNDPSGAPA